MKFALPEFPCRRDMWDALAEESRPIVIYGMGNGADKLIARFEERGISFADVFASDGFVRGHSYRGIRVKSFSEIKEKYESFVVVLSFGTTRPEVIAAISELDGACELYIPDMPIAGAEYFDCRFFNDNYASICAAYELFADEASRELYASLINYKLSGRLSDLLAVCSSEAELYSLINSGAPVRSLVDCGAYVGDTLKKAIAAFPCLGEAIAVEPDKKSYAKLEAYAETLASPHVRAVNAAVWSSCEAGSLQSSGNRNSSVVATPSFHHGKSDVPFVTVDSLVDERVDYIKYDVEGAEHEALAGSRGVISIFKPKLLVSAYHRSRDMFFLPLYLSSEHAGYKLYLRRLRVLPAWEVALVALP